MFDRRMKILLAAFAVFGGVLVHRLVDLQILCTKEYLEVASAPEKTPYKPIPPTRGRILVRGAGGKGTVELVGNELCFELAVYYPVMDPDEWWINDQHRLIRQRVREQAKNPKLIVPKEELTFRLHQDIDEFWTMLSKSTSTPKEELLGRRDLIVQSIKGLIDRVHAQQEDYVDYPILEQRMHYPLIPDLDEKQALELRGKLADNPWAVVRPSVRRVFRQKDILCHILGRTERIPGSISKTYQQTEEDHYLPGELRGKEGLELFYDKRLRGRRGWLKMDKEPRVETPPEDGRDIVLSIDIELQRFVQQRLTEQVHNLPYAIAGGAVVIDLRDNSLLAMVSVPTFDPEIFKDRTKYNKLQTDKKYLPMIDRVLNARYSPGSIVKPYVGAWAIEHGKVGSHQTYDCQGRLSENLNAFKCWLPPPGHGPMDFVEAIAHSCDIYFYRVGEIITAEGMTDLYRSIGFDHSVPLGVSEDNPNGLPNVPGHIPDQAWFIRRWGRGMSVGDARNLAIGQGDLLITPMQGVIMTKALITGTYQPPRVLTDEPDPPATPVGIRPSILRLARDGMYKVVNNPRATGYKDAYTDKIVLAAKTGSATAPPRPIEWEVSYQDPITGQTVKQIVTDKDKFIASAPVPEMQISWRSTGFFPTLKPEDQKDAYGRTKHLAHGWFTGYAPAGRPRIVALVFIEYGIAGGSGAGPVFKDIMLKCQDLGYLK